MGLQSAEIVLPARGRFDLRTTVLSHGYHQLPPFHWRDGARPELVRIERLPRGSVYRLSVRNDPRGRGVVVRATGVDADQVEVLAPLAARIRRALRLDEELEPFHRLCRRDPTLRAIVRRRAGRLLRGTTLFEDLVKAIAWTNTTWPTAVRTITELGRLGSPCPAERRLRAFPTPAQLVRAGTRRLRRETGLGYRSPWLVAAARDVVRGRLDLEHLEHHAAALSSDELTRALGAVRGVGPATTGYLLLMLGHYGEPAIDRAVLRDAGVVLFAGRRPTVSRLRRWAQRYGPWAGLALWCRLWLASPYARAAGRPASARLS